MNQNDFSERSISDNSLPDDLAFPIPVLSRSPTSVVDRRIDAITRRFSWFANPDEVWPNASRVGVTVHQPNQYHLRRRPQISCPACLRGELGQLVHMEGPHGCLYTEVVMENE